MVSAAAEADKRGLLARLYCSLYPKKWCAFLLRRLRLDRTMKGRKLLRRAVAIDEAKVRMIVWPEIRFNLIPIAQRHKWLAPLAAPFSETMRRMAAQTARYIYTGKPFDIYHYRAGFGGPSLQAARARGAILLCDHSIVHPLALDGLIQDGGHFTKILRRDDLCVSERLIQDDIDAADHVLVNSHFVKQSFDYVGYDTTKVSVIYQGVDEAFFEFLPAAVPPPDPTCTRLFFAGRFSDRKGGGVLIEALKRLPTHGWSLDIAGIVLPEYINPLSELQKTMPVRWLGDLDRMTLARAMRMADVFVFPTLAEGSARVIFEAMAAGCFIVTTANAGSVVENGKNGILVPPGDVDALAHALQSTLGNADIPAVGRNNAEFIKNCYRQKHYGEQLEILYKRLMQQSDTSKNLDFLHYGR